MLAVLWVGLAGCSTTTGTGQPAPDDAASSGTTGQPAKVTASDYEAAVVRLDACLKASGVELVNDGWDPVDNERMLLRFKGPGMSQDQFDQAVDRCQSAHLVPIAERYNADNKSRMAAELMAAVQACMRGKNISLTGLEQNPQDLLNAVPRSRHEELRTCVRESVRAVYPNLYSTSFP